jgi:hypothetical protein
MEFARQVAKSIEGCRIISAPTGEDINSLLVRDGIEGVRKLVGCDR